MENIVLKRDEIYQKVECVSKRILKDKLKLCYKRFKYQNYKFIMRENQYKDFDSKNLVELTLGWHNNKLVYFGSITKELDFLCDEHKDQIKAIRRNIDMNPAVYNSIVFQTGKHFKK